MPRVISRYQAEIAPFGVDLDPVLKVRVHEIHGGFSPELVKVPAVVLMAIRYVVPVDETLRVHDANASEARNVFLRAPRWTLVDTAIAGCLDAVAA